MISTGELQFTIESVLQKYAGEPTNQETLSSLRADIQTILEAQLSTNNPNFGQEALDVLYGLANGTYWVKV